MRCISTTILLSPEWREIWGFPKKLAEPSLAPNKDTLVGTLDYYGIRIATGTMGFKHQALDHPKDT